jgi:hypothetical protein
MKAMRILLAGFALLMAVPTVEAGTKPKSGCKNACGSTYTLCMKRSNTKFSRNACKTQKKQCRNGCKG